MRSACRFFVGFTILAVAITTQFPHAGDGPRSFGRPVAGVLRTVARRLFYLAGGFQQGAVYHPVAWQSAGR